MKKLSKWLMPTVMAFAVMFSNIIVAAPADGIYASPVLAYTVDAEAIASNVPIPASEDAVMASSKCGGYYTDNLIISYQTVYSTPNVLLVSADTLAKSEVGWRM